ncbi:uncharacterized protein LOC134207385 [Armigeres subalbatus]|uniref:uncharacterized protein LOC134207385 n=1 Tax=Armigeres subalbatus TaxID=124917 RepID=UPI002ED245F9
MVHNGEENDELLELVSVEPENPPEDKGMLRERIAQIQNNISSEYHEIILPEIAQIILSDLNNAIQMDTLTALLETLDKIFNDNQVSPDPQASNATSLHSYLPRILRRNDRNNNSANDLLRFITKILEDSKNNEIPPNKLYEIEKQFTNLMKHHFKHFEYRMRTNHQKIKAQEEISRNLSAWRQAKLGDIQSSIMAIKNNWESAEAMCELDFIGAHPTLTIMSKGTNDFAPLLKCILEIFVTVKKRIHPDLNSSLHYATNNRNEEFTNWLLNQNSLDVDIRNRWGKTALFELCENYRSARNFIVRNMPQNNWDSSVNSLEEYKNLILLVVKQKASFNICSDLGHLPWEILIQRTFSAFFIIGKETQKKKQEKQKTNEKKKNIGKETQKMKQEKQQTDKEKKEKQQMEQQMIDSESKFLKSIEEIAQPPISSHASESVQERESSTDMDVQPDPTQDNDSQDDGDSFLAQLSPELFGEGKKPSIKIKDFILKKSDLKSSELKKGYEITMEILEILLRFEKQDDFHKRIASFINVDEKKLISLLLHTAVEKGIEESVKLIVKLFEKKIFALDATNRFTHRLELRGLLRKARGNILSLLLDSMSADKVFLNEENILIERLTMAISAENSAEQSERLECANLMASSEQIDIYSTDTNGNTALHIALQNGFDSVGETLTETGKSMFLGVPNRKRESPLANAPYTFIGNYLNRCIESSKESESKREILINYDGFRSKNGSRYSAMNCVVEMANTRRKQELLNHPVIYTFVMIEWLKFSSWHFANILITLFATTCFCGYAYSQIIDEVSSPLTSLLGWVSFICVSFRELLQMIAFGGRYWMLFQNHVDLLSIIGMGVSKSYETPNGRSFE